jgi:hypothetical protein
LGVVLVLLAIPAAALLAVAVGAPHVLLKDVFHHAYAATASTLAPLGVAMILLSISVILTMYLLAIGRRWVAGVLAAGALALGLAVSLVHGRPHATGLVDLAVQAGVLGVILVGFTAVHRVRLSGQHQRNNYGDQGGGREATGTGADGALAGGGPRHRETQ